MGINRGNWQPNINNAPGVWYPSALTQVSSHRIQVLTGRIEEFVALIPKVPELNQAHAFCHYQTRLDGKRHLILIARKAGEVCGFKVGYELDDSIFYSWVGGVLPAHRRSGVAQALLDAQESWVWSYPYQAIRVKTSAKFPAMILFLEKNAYQLQMRRESTLVYAKQRTASGFKRWDEKSGRDRGTTIQVIQSDNDP